MAPPICPSVYYQHLVVRTTCNVSTVESRVFEHPRKTKVGSKNRRIREIQWRTQGRGPGVPPLPPPLIWDKKRYHRRKKSKTKPPPTPYTPSLPALSSEIKLQCSTEERETQPGSQGLSSYRLETRLRETISGGSNWIEISDSWRNRG